MSSLKSVSSCFNKCKSFWLSRRFLTYPQDVVEELSTENLPKGTGRGPFIEIPKFKPLGDPCRLLNITIPRFSLLNIKNGSIVALNGHLEGLRSSQRILNNTTYQELLTELPISILISGASKSYSVIEIKDKEEKWTFFGEKNLIAWSGIDMDIHSRKHSDKIVSFESEGKGTIVIDGKGELFDITLEKDEVVFINPESLIATNVDVAVSTLNNSWAITSFGRFPRPFHIIRQYYDKARRSFLSALTSSFRNLRSNPTFDKVCVYWSRFVTYIKLSVINWMLDRPIYLKAKGPGRLLISNTIHLSNRSFFTKKEIDRALKK